MSSGPASDLDTDTHSVKQEVHDDEERVQKTDNEGTEDSAEEGDDDEEASDAKDADKPSDTTGKPVKKFRRKHKNSKSGCSNCKQRKIKCDERLPVCTFCKKRNIQCSYLTMTPFQIHQIVCSHKKGHRAGEDETGDFSYADDGDNNVIFDKNDTLPMTPSSPKTRFEPTPDPPPVGVQYKPMREISLENDSDLLGNPVYHAYKIEGVLLPPSLGSNVVYNAHEANPYVPLRTRQQYLPLDCRSGDDGLKPRPLSSNARKSQRSFKLSSSVIIKSLDEFAQTSLTINKLLHKRDFQSLGQLTKGQKIDTVLHIDYMRILSISQIFKKLLRKSLILLAADYYKNVLLKQSILPLVNYKIKLSISCKCENESVVLIDEITNIIKFEYIPFFPEFSLAGVNLFTGCFYVLNDCLVYHFKSGLKYDLNFEEGNNAIKLLGIFSTGFYSIIMERSRAELLMSGANILSAHLITHFKKLLIRNYHMEVLDEVKKVLDKLCNSYLNNVDYENLRMFFEEHCRLLKLNVHKHSLLGFNNGYLVRILNSYTSILPSQFCNLNPKFAEQLRGQELTVVIYLFYYATGQILNSIIPGIKTIAANSFVGTAWDAFEFDHAANLMKVFALIESRELQVVAIFLIRTASFFRCHRLYYQHQLANFPLKVLLDEESTLSLEQRYAKLLAAKEEGVMDEIRVKSFALQKGQYVQRWNFPNTGRLKPRRGSRVSLNKIANRLPTDELLVADFVRSNNGFFTHDHDPAADLAGDHAVAMGASFIDGFEMKTLWKLVVYIRINNL